MAQQGRWPMAGWDNYVIRLDDTSCLQLWNVTGQMAEWLQRCHDTCIHVRL